MSAALLNWATQAAIADNPGIEHLAKLRQIATEYREHDGILDERNGLHYGRHDRPSARIGVL